MEQDILLNDKEIAVARECLEMALAKGASKARVALTKSRMNLVGTLDGAVDKINSCLDRSLNVALFINGRFGTFATNRCESSELDGFLDKAFDTVSRLAPDPFRDLPAPERVCKDAVDGLELKLYDPACLTVTPERRVAMALEASICKHKDRMRAAAVQGASIFVGIDTALPDYDIVSEEGEYSDSICDTLMIDSQGACCRHIETSFDYGVEITVKDGRGRRFSRYSWDSSTKLSGLNAPAVCDDALAKAVQAINPRRSRSQRCNMVLDRECSTKVVSPLLRALSAYSLQQGDSFLMDSLGKKLFPEGLTILDCPHIAGECGSRLFDSEGVATREAPIIEKGVVKTYFVNTYMSGKTGLAPTVDEASRPAVLPWGGGVRSAAGTLENGFAAARKSPCVLDREAIVALCGEGILVTGFNGGNYNSTTGDFSYGVEGFAFKNGRITHPVREMVVTGNLLSLWQGLIAAGDDARRCSGRLVGTLAFRDVDFSA